MVVEVSRTSQCCRKKGQSAEAFSICLRSVKRCHMSNGIYTTSRDLCLKSTLSCLAQPIERPAIHLTDITHPHSSVFAKDSKPALYMIGRRAHTYNQQAMNRSLSADSHDVKSLRSSHANDNLIRISSRPPHDHSDQAENRVSSSNPVNGNAPKTFPEVVSGGHLTVIRGCRS